MFRNNHYNILLFVHGTSTHAVVSCLPLEYNLEHEIIIITGMGISDLAICHYLELREYTHTQSRSQHPS